MTIIEDIHEPNEIEKKIKSKGILVDREVLEVGDYLLPKSYGIERKYGRDLMSSVASGRLFEQLNNLNQLENPILVIVSLNIWKDFYYTNSKYVHSQYIGLLTTITTKYPKMRVLIFDSDDMFTSYIISLYRKITEDKKSERPSPVMRRPRSMKMRKENTLTAIEGISISKSKKLLKVFGSIRNVANANLNELEKVDGVGKKLAEKIRETLN